tara:strand:- start:90 stop:1256 length:1167 start_codon:yes stop_codon:yes gene_type:complete
MLKIKKIRNFNLKSKKILIRVDLNVPTKNGIITDETRIKNIIPSLKKIISNDGLPVIISHLGRPKKKDSKYSLKKIVKPLSKSLGKKVFFINDCIGINVVNALNKIKPGQILLLENLRFHKEEMMNDITFAKKLSKPFDIYINEAFSASHRNHASIDKITKFLPSGIGINMEKELFNLHKFLHKPRQPLTAIIGGSKMESKIKTINNLIKKCTFLILGGGIANTFLKSKNINIGKSIYEKKQIKNAIDIQKLAKNRGCEIILPVDVVVSNKNKSIDIKDIKNNYKIFDVGIKTINIIKKKINCSSTVIWSGPLGFFEKKPFDNSTNKISNIINSNKRLISIAGGGDTIAAIKKNKKFKNFTFLSTGGGAFLSWLEKYTLPGIEVLKKN